MENENVHEPYANVEVGEDVPQVEPKKVKLETYRVEAVKNKEGKEIGKKLILCVRHPDITDRLLEISGARYTQGDKLKTTGLWWKEDNEGKIPFKSAFAHVLRHYGKRTLKGLIGLELATLTDEGGYLVVKGY